MTKINELLNRGDVVPSYRESDQSELFRQAGLLVIALVLGGLFAFPFYWLLKVAIMWPAQSLYGGNPSLIIENPSLVNFVKVWHTIPFLEYFTNSVIITAMAIASQLLFCSLAAYALTLDIYGKRYLLGFMIAAMLIPFQTIFLPDFLVTQRLGLIDSYTGLAIVVAVSVINILVIRNSFEAIPQDMTDAARLDGASELYILFGVYWPLSKPALSTVTILSFIFSWNSFLWPLVAVKSEEYMPLPLGLAKISTQMSGNFTLQYAFAIMVLLPVLVVFLLLQRQFIKSAVLGSIKG
jgi:ABC-type glycerol-3-phosphate transport system permease component